MTTTPADDEPDGAPYHRWEVTEGWTPPNDDWRKYDEHNPEGT